MPDVSPDILPHRPRVLSSCSIRISRSLDFNIAPMYFVDHSKVSRGTLARCVTFA